MADLLFGKRHVLTLDLKECREDFLSEGKGKVIACRGAEDGKGAATVKVRYGTWRLRVTNNAVIGKDEPVWPSGKALGW